MDYHEDGIRRNILLTRGKERSVMTSKERVNLALNHQEPDRTPVDFWAESIVIDKLIQHLSCHNKDALLSHFQVDFRYVEGAKYIGPPLPTSPEGFWKDIWGVKRQLVEYAGSIHGGTYQHVVAHPLAEVSSTGEVEKYNWPDANWYDYSSVEEECSPYSQYAVVCGGNRLNRTAQLKAAMYLRGMSQILTDLALNPGIAEAIIQHLVDFYLEYNKNIFENANGKIDIFFMGDDFGTQQSCLVSPDMWKKFFAPGFKKFIDLAHSYGIKVMHHTCGAVAPLIPHFIECGLDVLQSLQPKAQGMDPLQLKRRYGKHISFQGGLDIQDLLPRGTPDQVRAETQRLLGIMGKGGGYILGTSHNIQPDTPLENIIALYEGPLGREVSGRKDFPG